MMKFGNNSGRSDRSLNKNQKQQVNNKNVEFTNTGMVKIGRNRERPHSNTGMINPNRMMPPQQQMNNFNQINNPFYQPEMNTQEFNFNNDLSYETRMEMDFKLNELQRMYSSNMISLKMYENKKEEIIFNALNKR